MNTSLTGSRGSLPDAVVRLTRASVAARTPGVVIANRDLPQLDQLTGSRGRSQGLLARLSASGQLRPVRRGTYVLVGTDGTVRVDVLDLIAAVTAKPYLVTAGRALEFHDLTDQHFGTVNVLTRTQMRAWAWRGSNVRYSVTDSDFSRCRTRTRRTRAAIANPQRAIADSLEHPRWGVTLPQVAEAMDIAQRRDPEAADRLAILIANSYGFALARRLGWLVALLMGDDAARGFLPLRGKSKGATPLLTGVRDSGPVDPVWQVRVNIDPGLLTSHREHR